MSGMVEIGQNKVTYTGVQPGGTGSKTAPQLTDPASALIATQVFGFTFPNNWTGYYAFTFVNAAGEETSIGDSISGLYTNNSGGSVDYSLTSIDTGPTGTTARKVYRTANGGGGGLKLLTTINNNSSTTYTDQTADNALGSSTAPATGSNATSAPAGSTALRVMDCAQFLSGGGWAEAGGVVFSYTGRSVSSGVGSLTGIPASGSASLTGTVGPGQTVTTVPHLTGCSGIVYAINKGDPANILVTVNDAAAQTALAALVGGDGIHEHFISDGTIGVAEATARANAELSLRKDPLVTVGFTSRDPSMQSGRDVTLTITSPSINGTFKIQRVTITQLGLQGPTGFLFPLRQVEASSRRYSFEDVLRKLKAGS